MAFLQFPVAMQNRLIYIQQGMYYIMSKVPSGKYYSLFSGKNMLSRTLICKKKRLSWLHCNENTIYVFLFWELHSLSPNFHIHVPVSDLYIPRIGPHISCSRIGWEYINLSQTHEFVNWDCGRAIPFLGKFVSNFRYWFSAMYWMKAEKMVAGTWQKHWKYLD